MKSKISLPSGNPFEHIRSGWRKIAGKKIYFRSNLEYDVASMLETMKANKRIISWEYEPKIFWFESIKRGTRSYKPDFYVQKVDKTFVWLEAKGYLDKKSNTKVKRFRKYYPDETLEIIYDPLFLYKIL